uniref:ABI gene family member 3 n=1 Tax=Sus scrofa TaxID=9823 RepID=A0A8D1S8S4_PIG
DPHGPGGSAGQPQRPAAGRGLLRGQLRADGEHAYGKGGPKGDRYFSHRPAAAPQPENHRPREPTSPDTLLQETPQLWLPGRHWPWDQGFEHAAVSDRDPVSKEHQGACRTRLRHPRVRPRRDPNLPRPSPQTRLPHPRFKPGAKLPPASCQLPATTSSPSRPPACQQPSLLLTPFPSTPRRAPRIPEPVQPPVVPNGKLSAASSASSLASAGSAEGVGGVSAVKGQAAPPPPPPAASDVFLLPPPLEELPLPPPAPELPLPLDLPPPPPLDVDDLGLPPPPPPGFGPEEPSWIPDAYLEKVVTLYPYTGQKDNELSFSEGTVICITRRYSDGWCEGVSSEGSGFFPGNYVEPSC